MRLFSKAKIELPYCANCREFVMPETEEACPKCAFVTKYHTHEGITDRIRSSAMLLDNLKALGDIYLDNVLEHDSPPDEWLRRN